MEERNDRKNTMLLTVIAIATLLVAVIGATFAYFTATIRGRETASTVVVGGSRLEITFADGSSTLLTNSNLNPVKPATGTTNYAPVITKNFTLTGTNTTGEGTTAPNSGMRMPYELYLMVNENTFQLQHTAGSKTYTSLTYKLVNNSTSLEGTIPSNADYANIPATTVTGLDCPLCGTTTGGTYGQTYDALQTTALGNVTLYNDAGTALTPAQGLKLGNGYFPAGANDAVHSYTLNIYFNETGNNQDFDKGKVFTGYVAISTGNNAISTTADAVNSAN